MPEPTTPAPDTTATLTVTVHAPDADNAARWAESIGQLVTAEFGNTMRLSASITTPGPSAGRDTMREAIAGALAQTDDICGMDHGFTDPCIDIIPDAIIDAVLAVRDGELQQLRAKVRRLTSDLAETAGLEETAADRYQNALHWQERAEEAEATIDRVRDTLPFAEKVIATSGPGPASAVQAVLDRLRTALTAPTMKDETR